MHGCFMTIWFGLFSVTPVDPMPRRISAAFWHVCDKKAVSISYCLPEGRWASSEPASPRANRLGWSPGTPPHPPADPADTAPIEVLLAEAWWAGMTNAFATPAQRNTRVFDKTVRVQLGRVGFASHRDEMRADSAGAEHSDVIRLFRWVVKVLTWDLVEGTRTLPPSTVCSRRVSHSGAAIREINPFSWRSSPSQKGWTWWVWGVCRCRSVQTVRQDEYLSWPSHQQLQTAVREFSTGESNTQGGKNVKIHPWPSEIYWKSRYNREAFKIELKKKQNKKTNADKIKMSVLWFKLQNQPFSLAANV